MATLPHHTSGAGSPVLLIHGTAPDLFDALQAELSRDHRVIRFDRRGFGASGLSPVRALTPHAEDAAALLDAHGPAIIVGWSMGGVIALEAAMLRPDKVRGLVLLEPPWLLQTFPSLRVLAMLVSVRLRQVLGAHASAGRRFLRWALARRDGRCELDELSSADAARVDACGSAILRDFDAGTGEHFKHRLTGPLAAPTRLLVGTDSTPEFAAAAARLAKVLALEPIAIAGAGHMLQQTHAPLVAAHVRELGSMHA